MTKEKILQAYEDKIISAKRRDFLLKVLQVKAFRKIGTVKERCEFLCISEQTYYRMIRQ